MNINKEVLRKYCTGCGLCHSVSDVTFQEDDRGYLVPSLREEDIYLCGKVCPASGNALKNYQDGTIWGEYRQMSLGWSTNHDVREGASSGGVLTAICLYLLEKGVVDGIIQTKKSSTDVRKSETVVSRTQEDVLRCMGSRYTTSSPLMNIKEQMKSGETYAFIGKPCDVSALRIYMEEEAPEMKEQIKYLFSFFCAGQPSIRANNRLIESLGAYDFGECADLSYRGNGWPGFATLTKKDGSEERMDYETSWMKILGRDIRKICRFCADGTGELSDISCGDAWYLGDNGRPDFSEHPGRNVILVRTEKGDDLLRKVERAGGIYILPFDPDKDGLKKMQPYHYTRKASLRVYKLALHLCGRKFPLYDSKVLSGYANGFSVKQKVLRFCGTVVRVLKGVI